MTTLGKRLKQLRRERGLSQYDMAKHFQMPRSTYANYETGVREPDMITVTRIADFFGVSADFLFGRVDDPNGGYDLMDPDTCKKVMDNLNRELEEGRFWQLTQVSESVAAGDVPGEPGNEPGQVKSASFRGDRLKELRLSRKESQRVLADFIGVTETTIRNYETGRREPEAMALLTLASHYGVSSEYLMGITDDPKRQQDLPPGWENVLREAARQHMSADDVTELIQQLGTFMAKRRSQD